MEYDSPESHFSAGLGLSVGCPLPARHSLMLPGCQHIFGMCQKSPSSSLPISSLLSTSLRPAQVVTMWCTPVTVFTGSGRYLRSSAVGPEECFRRRQDACLHCTAWQGRHGQQRTLLVSHFHEPGTHARSELDGQPCGGGFRNLPVSQPRETVCLGGLRNQ